MFESELAAVDGQTYPFTDANDGQRWVSQWFGPNSEPEGTCHGSAAICLTSEDKAVIGRHDGARWEMPGGRPDPGETWLETLEREVMEEVCAEIQSAELLGYVRAERLEGIAGKGDGRVLVRSVWMARVTLLPWEPLHEITHRGTLPLDSALDLVECPDGQRPIYVRWAVDAIAAATSM